MIHYPLAFILLLTPLVFIHELGHFLFAKLFGVRVDVFSIGFGPKVFKFRKGETEYCFSAIPLGGYVKLFGQDPTEEVSKESYTRSFMSKAPYQRFFILLGGPLFNLLFAVAIFSTILLMGEPHVGTKVGRVLDGSLAQKAGFQVNDLITSVNGVAVSKSEEYLESLIHSADKELTVAVKRNAEEKKITVTPKPTQGMSVYGEPIMVGDIEGLLLEGREAVVAVLDKNSQAAKAGLSTGDMIISLNGKPVDSYEALEIDLKNLQTQKVLNAKIEYKKITLENWLSKEDPSEKNIQVKTAELPTGSLASLGINSTEMLVAGFIPDAPAEKAGLKAGDYLDAINGKKLNSFYSLKDAVQKAGQAGEKIILSYVRDGKSHQLNLTPITHEIKDVTGETMKTYAIGIFPLMVQAKPFMVIEKIYNPVALTMAAWGKALDLSAKTFISLKKLFTRQVSMKTLGGPLLIGKLAGDSIHRGLLSFLKVMALISISLAVFNILPVPVLDGGHIVLLGLEVIRGKPLGNKQTEIVQQVGLSLIMFLLVVVLFNDITKVAVPAIQNIFR